MSKRLGVLIVAVFAFAVFPAVAVAGGEDATNKRAEKLAKMQEHVDSFVACLNDGKGLPLVPDIDVDAVLSERKLAHRGRGGFGHRGFGRRGGKLNRVARFVVRAAELDRTDQAVRDAVKACRDAARESLATERQPDVKALADCLVREGQAVDELILADRPRLASKRGFLRRSARMMLRTAEISPRDADVRADVRTCVKEVRGGATT